MNKDFYRTLCNDPMVRTYYDAWLNGQYRTFEEMLVDLVTAQSMSRDKLLEGLARVSRGEGPAHFVIVTEERMKTE